MFTLKMFNCLLTFMVSDMKFTFTQMIISLCVMCHYCQDFTAVIFQQFNYDMSMVFFEFILLMIH